MKTRISLLVTVIGSILFWGGCASTETNDVRTWYKIACNADDHGIWRHQNSRTPITGRVVEYAEGELRFEFFVKDGVKDGRFREWHIEGGKIRTGHPYIDAVYENGEIVRLKKYWWNANTPEETGHNWWNGTEWQLILKGWNKDGTPDKE